MLLGPDPLGERLALVGHNHFATGNQKVSDLATMRRQNDLFRSRTPCFRGFQGVKSYGIGRRRIAC